MDAIQLGHPAFRWVSDETGWKARLAAQSGCGLLFTAAQGENIREMDEATKLSFARKSFTFVVEELPPNNPFTAELRRYMDEALPSVIGSVPLPPGLN